jgi:hypothetical protein
MRGTCRVFAVVALLTTSHLDMASAQSMPDRIRINVDAGVQIASTTFDSSATKRVYIEDGVIGASYKLQRGPVFDAGFAVRLIGPIGVGLTVSSYSERSDAAVSAAIPHPFFFKTPRTITGTASGLQREELVAHLQGMYTLQPTARVDVALSAGPSFFRVRQELVTDVTFADTYPYDAPTFTTAASQRITAKNAVGFNVGADIGLRLWRHAGVGGAVRFTRASVSLAIPNGTAVSSDAGGTQIAGGLRLYF